MEPSESKVTSATPQHPACPHIRTHELVVCAHSIVSKPRTRLSGSADTPVWKCGHARWWWGRAACGPPSAVALDDAGLGQPGEAFTHDAGPSVTDAVDGLQVVRRRREQRLQ